MFVCACLLCALTIVETTTLNIEGHVGKNITANCVNWNVGTNVKYKAKYICDSPCTKDKHIITKAEYGQTKKKNRIELTNGGDSLYVTFFNLERSDTQKYYCGVEILGFDALIEVNLKVIDDPVTVTVRSYADLKSSTVPTTNLEIITELSDSNTTLDTTPTASASRGSRSVLYLTVGVIIILTTLIVLWRVMRTARRQLKVVSSAGSPQEDAQVDVEYDEIRHDDPQTETEPVASTVSFSTATADVDPDSLYANYSYLHDTESDAVYSKDVSFTSASSFEVSLKGPCAESDLVYSVAQLPKGNIEQARVCEPTQFESIENDCLYSLAQLPQAS
ncbi:uncharacterized protein LOC111575013 isoform X1 [Amphiprion ocellaris]|uniref:uncharacterized protein LOC111575013 isoform X1 n=1 Tax=Amphiprion ocellaris TaxID=80972 RepID=UPI00241174CC|nr:uncharacterized protein LOC111575013 isoform X1 [Amphiprion ocellaris]XP_035808561.2 uncharacterized protein LOC111575013 isoform X1 [Amphiprion ocellaris]XP_054865547.1 uncharacterized protein LOC111575013 isoform X1 [Amphiprion ocellaris]XP_054865548.1 uncharacterized protein LOC111575013 isoform X1 [Amphiprion ocellaris]